MSQYEFATEAYETGEFGEFGEAEFGEAEFGEAEFGEMGELEAEAVAPINEMQEMELASELLEITNEAELEQFLGGLIKGVGGFLKSGAGKALGGVLKTVAKKALPIVGGALGSFVAPGVGTAIGSKLGSMASNLFELELEGVPAQEAEFEVARRYVRFATAAARAASRAPQNLPPRVIANRAIAAAARRYAPGVLRVGISNGSTGYGSPYGSQYGYDGGGGYDGYATTGARSGRWVRRGNKVVLHGL
jgi:hypothetical protein